MLRPSRSLLPEIFCSQNSGRVAGIVARLHPSCPCQKQPWTKITALYFGSTISGLPGSCFLWSRKRYPILCRRERTTFSGLVFLPLIRAIVRLRCSGLIVSTGEIYPQTETVAKTSGNEKGGQSRHIRVFPAYRIFGGGTFVKSLCCAVIAFIQLGSSFIPPGLFLHSASFAS